VATAVGNVNELLPALTASVAEPLASTNPLAVSPLTDPPIV
jgi:hypothetical protein